MLREILQRVVGEESHVSSNNKLRRCFVYGMSDAGGVSPNNRLLRLKYSDLDPELKLRKKV